MNNQTVFLQLKELYQNQLTVGHKSMALQLQEIQERKTTTHEAFVQLEQTHNRNKCN